LVKKTQHLIDTYSSHPKYYNFSNSGYEIAQNFYEYGLQKSRGFRALKVWLILQQVGRSGYEKLISEDIELSEMLYDLAEKYPELEAVSQNLSITTFRYVPTEKTKNNEYLNKLNEGLLNELQTGGEVFLSNAIVFEKYCLRACIVNLRTAQKDII
jgi:aromatic-L-amino-acid decarboxylase